MSSRYDFLVRNWRIDVMGITACALFTGVCYAGLIRPVSANRLAYAELQPQLAERAQAVKDARAGLAALQAELDATKKQLSDLPLELEPASRVNSRLARLTDLAAEMGIEVHQVQPDPARAGKRYDVVEIALSGSGDYGQVTRFMRRLHDTFADTAIVTFDLKSGGATVAAAQFDIGLAWYTLPAMGFVDN
jgi:Tfp pilus assembly protein PilO